MIIDYLHFDTHFIRLIYLYFVVLILYYDTNFIIESI